MSGDKSPPLHKAPRLLCIVLGFEKRICTSIFARKATREKKLVCLQNSWKGVQLVKWRLIKDLALRNVHTLNQIDQRDTGVAQGQSGELERWEKTRRKKKKGGMSAKLSITCFAATLESMHQLTSQHSHEQL